MSEIKKRTRCAVYTRKSNEEGLEQEFNSLDAQRHACENYVASQRSQGWMLVPDYYDDGGFTGGNTERPALKRLLKDIEEGRIDTVIVYKIDRLSRSLLDFLNMMKVFEEYNVAFVSVTQHFDTSTSMGKLMLNVLLSFAQFEREITGERIRDKIAASKQKGMWMGGVPPFGYDGVDRRLEINEAEAEIVRHIFQRFTMLESVTEVVKELRRDGVRTKTYTTTTGKNKVGKIMDKGFVYKMMGNQVYLGEIVHKDKVYPGQHKAIIDREVWDKARQINASNPHVRANSQRREMPAMLRGIIRCDGCNCAMTPYHARKKGKLYRYYTPSGILKTSCELCPVGSIPAGEIETIVLAQLKSIFKTPELIVRVWQKTREQEPNVKESQIREAFKNIDEVWDELFPAEQERIVKLLIQNVIVGKDGVDLRIRATGIGTLISHVKAMQPSEAA